MFFDKKAEGVLERYESFLIDDPYYFLAGSSGAFEYSMKLAGDICGKRVLDYGCGSGWLSVHLAKMGANVCGFDISSKMLEVGVKRAQVNGVLEKLNFQKMKAEELSYPDDFFDAVLGVSVLHHIDIDKSARELTRTMKKGARSIFIEPLGENRLLNYVRSRGIQGRTKNEHPLKYADIERLKAYFSKVEYTEFQLFGMFERFIGSGLARFLKLDSLDRWLLSRFPGLKKLCRLVVISVEK
ncbi:MAG: class I SAM-dependent methyltransferase [Candidatus Omnitrophica bacterium]|nr:class I SAM-dependent methyltransferase [Candidatus Omnitrophota bacterium]